MHRQTSIKQCQFTSSGEYIPQHDDKAKIGGVQIVYKYRLYAIKK